MNICVQTFKFLLSFLSGINILSFAECETPYTNLWKLYLVPFVEELDINSPNEKIIVRKRPIIGHASVNLRKFTITHKFGQVF